MAILPGFRFHPTDEELVGFYLRRKIGGRSEECNIIAEVDLYKQEPWDLPEKSHKLDSDLEWFFFCPRERKYSYGSRTNRATEAGYWKATGRDREVRKLGRLVGMKKTLVFHLGRAPNGERTDWVMHEYRLEVEECEDVKASKASFVLCRVFKKSGIGPRSDGDRGPQTYVDEEVIGGGVSAVRTELPEVIGGGVSAVRTELPEDVSWLEDELLPVESNPGVQNVDDFLPPLVEESGTGSSCVGNVDDISIEQASSSTSMAMPEPDTLKWSEEASSSTSMAMLEPDTLEWSEEASSSTSMAMPEPDTLEWSEQASSSTSMGTSDALEWSEQTSSSTSMGTSDTLEWSEQASSTSMGTSGPDPLVWGDDAFFFDSALDLTWLVR